MQVDVELLSPGDNPLDHSNPPLPETSVTSVPSTRSHLLPRTAMALKAQVLKLRVSTLIVPKHIL